MARTARLRLPPRLVAGLCAALAPALAGCSLPWSPPAATTDYPQLRPMDEILAEAGVAPPAPAP